jgi:2-polyprenyl-3-methyl-5-hydroxy-6-metoxy-1,4-benzoquinol methylase
VAVDTLKKYDPDKYWAERYKTIDITKSGHVDLPVVYNQWLYRRKKERLFAALRTAGFAAEGKAILDVAAGTGVYVEAWKSLKVKSLVGVDISANAVASLQTRFPEYAFHKYDLSVPGMAATTGKGFDLVTAIDMLYHITVDETLPGALANLAEPLKPGGLLVIHDMFLHCPELDFGYIKLRTMEKYKAALEAAGFELLNRSPTFFLSVQSYDYVSPRAARMAKNLWDRFTDPLIHRFPNLAGPVGYWVDRLLGGIFSEGTSFEMLVCRRKAG